jgi:hypothetical protein
MATRTARGQTEFDSLPNRGTDAVSIPPTHGGKYPDYSFWGEAGTAVTHAHGHGRQDQPASDPRSNLP